MTVYNIIQIAEIWAHVGGSSEGAIVAPAVAVCLAESGGNPNAVNPATGDAGLWQINPINFAHYGVNSSTVLDTYRNALIAVAMSSNGYNWAPWCTAWDDPADNCGHGLLRQPQQNSPAGRLMFEVQSTLAAHGRLTGTVTVAPDTPHTAGVSNAWADIQRYASHGAPAQYANLAQLRGVLQRGVH